MDIESLLNSLHRLADLDNLEGMSRFGINTSNALGIPMPNLRSLAKGVKKDTQLAMELWDTGIHEARILAALIANPTDFPSEVMDEWVAGFDSWDVCDQCCSNLFRYTPFAIEKIRKWCASDEEFTRRAGFSLIAVSGLKTIKFEDKQYEEFLSLVEIHSTDSRNMVKKAVNWALRQIGKRNMQLHPLALNLAIKLKSSTDPTARWIGSDAYRELTNEKIVGRIK
jgi:3-methyladenine DNA glycosylase AlkD